MPDLNIILYMIYYCRYITWIRLKSPPHWRHMVAVCTPSLWPTSTFCVELMRKLYM